MRGVGRRKKWDVEGKQKFYPIISKILTDTRREKVLGIQKTIKLLQKSTAVRVFA